MQKLTLNFNDLLLFLLLLLLNADNICNQVTDLLTAGLESPVQNVEKTYPVVQCSISLRGLPNFQKRQIVYRLSEKGLL